MDLLLQRHQYVIRQLRKNIPNISVNQLLDEIVLFLNNTTHNPTDGFHVLSIICSDFVGIHLLKLFDDPKIMNHKFFLIIAHTFTMLLTKATYTSLTKEDEQCFDGISLLISNLCLYKNKTLTCFYTDNNEQLNTETFDPMSYEKIFFTESFMKKLVRIITKDIVINAYEPYHIKYKVIDRLLRLCMKLNRDKQELILDSVVKCLESESYLHMYDTIDLYEPRLSPKQSFFMYQCPKFLRLFSYNRQDKISQDICIAMLEYSVVIFKNKLSIALGHGSELDEKTKQNDTGAKIQAIAWHIELLNHFALTPGTREYFLRSTDGNNSMVNQMIDIISTESLIQSVQKNAQLFHADVALMSYSITLLYNLSFEKTVVYKLKERNIIEICKKLYEAKDSTIRFASLTLGAILNQKDTDGADSPTKIARSYLYFIENTIDDVTHTYHGIKLDGILKNLEIIVQYDNVKEEITNDDYGTTLIGRCAYDPSLDDEKIRRPALLIIDAMSFSINESAIEYIKEYDALMDHIKLLSNKKDDTHQAEIAIRILWKVENESTFISQQKMHEKYKTVTRKKDFDEKKAIYQYVTGDHRYDLQDHTIPDIFDIMISYCQSDKELGFKIYNRLKEANFYRVSFDTDNTHSSKPEEMANAIEKSSIVIICRSNEYRDTKACRLEAEYAEKRERYIIPVNVGRGYKPIGWLNKLIEDKVCIDFVGPDFNTMYAELIEEINKIMAE